MDDATRFDDCVLQAILSRLPAKSLGQLKCTSKRWHKLISCPLFAATQAQRSVGNVLGILSVTAHPLGGRLVYVPLDEGSNAPNTGLGLPRRHRSRISIRAACNGLIFCRLSDPDMNRNRYILGNPTMKHFNYRVPDPSTDRIDTQFGLAFDPSTTPPAAVKLVAVKLVPCTGISRPEWQPHYQFDIYSPQMNTWRTSGATMDCNHWKLFDLASSVYVNGALHWLREKGDVVAFDVENERAYAMSLPGGVEAEAVGGYSDVWFGVARGRMSVVKFDDRGIRVWEKEYYGGGWELKKCVEMIRDGGGYHRRNVPLMYDGEKCVLLTWSQEELRQRECGLAVYWFAAGRWDQIRRLQGSMDCCRQFCPYISHMVGFV